MRSVLKISLAAAVMALGGPLATPSSAADLGGSIKDEYIPQAMPIQAGAAGPCYIRGDVGYSVAGDPDVTWPVNNGTFTGDANANGIVDANEITYTRVATAVTNVSLENTWLAEGGIGCGSGSRGFRAEAVFGYRGSRDLEGVPGIYDPGPPVGSPVGGSPGPIDDPLHTSIQTYTAMFNVYKDFGVYRGFTPYIGAGIGVAYHDMDEVYFTGNPNLVNRIEGDQDIAFAWSLMAGVGYQVSNRSILDFGYRYINMGQADSGRVDTAGFVNPRVEVDNIDAHEFKVGMRYHFGNGDCCAYGPMK